MHKICEICKKAPATVHLTDIKNNVKKEMHMCESCAAEKGINIAKTTSFGQAFASAQAPLDNARQRHARIICENCGISWAEFREHGRLGCPEDYKVFRKGLEPLLEDVHSSRLHHAGKAPRQDNEQDGQKLRLELQRRLREAVAREDYELAASLRDQIGGL